jgi:dihydropteroate synthase
MMLTCGRYRLDLSRPRIMGILNLTLDSFSGDGLAGDLDRALVQAERFIAEGAEMLDLGAESSRPGAEPVPESLEMDRVLPLVERLRDCGVPLSVDTCKPAVMRAAIAAGADMVNDIMGLQAPGALEAVAADARVAVCIMHMQGEPRTMQNQPSYYDVVAEVNGFLQERAARARAAGIAAERIVLDPGFGFGKRREHNLALLARFEILCGGGYPVLAGLSRKSVLAAITGRQAPEERVYASVAAALMAVERGAAIVRVHDVAATRDALSVLEAVREQEREME